ncbi:GDP-fucose protein O-fucosyltransferase [Trichostrongylus colubriformis]|uniref:GDP-fucose protein O-fucosyltransferase 1 n=1 Tax=Trichostrongylus colubriformis TaxID=6319 RepID=A0AAN8IK66_TRICO
MSVTTVLIWLFIGSTWGADFALDPNGYVVFCPCMGRFGNQVDQLLGVMQFTNYLDRTLVLPNFIEYPYPDTVMVPFENIFQVAEIRKYMKAVRMVVFQREIMPKLWPKENRTALCWSPRKSIYDDSAPVGCHAKEGNPFGPYWDKIGVSFAHDAYYGQLPGGHDLTAQGSKAAWLERFPPSEFPVLAFPSPPAPFPSRPNTWDLQRYLKWSPRIMGRAKQFIKEKLSTPFVGIHLRNDKDWDRVCEHIPSASANQPLFASMQCEGEEFYDGKLTKEICSPSATTVIEQVIDVVGSIGARSVFVSSDKDHMIDPLNEALRAYDVNV